MKKIIMIVALLWSIPGIAQVKSATLVASGLTCSMCSRAIFKAIEALPVVKSLDVDIEKSSYAIVFKDGMKVNIDEVKNAVENAGFFVASLQVTAGFSNVAVGGDAHVEVDGATFHFVDVPKQVLNGDKTVTMIDKGYLPAKAHKKYSRKTAMKCYETGYMASCCPGYAGESKRIYHVTL